MMMKGRGNRTEMECTISSRIWGTTYKEKNELKGAKVEGALTGKDKQRGDEE